MPDTQDFTIPQGGEQPARNPNHRQIADYLKTIRFQLLPLRQLEAALTQSLLHPIGRLQTASLMQRLHDTHALEFLNLTQPEDIVWLSAVLEWRQLPSEGGAE